jgi:hypothetical protein
MRARPVICAVVLALTLWTGLYAFQRGGFRSFFPEEESPVPPDANEKTEWAFARLRYPSYRGNGLGGYWAMRGNWFIDAPAADRHFVQGVRRLTRIHTRSEYQVVDLDSDEIYNWPWIYAVEVGHWELNDTQCKKLRDFLLRGGFLMVDDFHGTFEWRVFTDSMSRVFPDRPIVELENDNAIFHVLYDLSDRVQVPGIAALVQGKTYEYDGYEPRWRAIMDDKGRVMVAICHNMDLGDSWEHADSPMYPEKFTSHGYRIGINYIIYAMTH